MSLQKTEAIVLRSINQGETSKILILYSQAFGKLSVMAKGARNIKSRFAGNLETLNHLAVVFYGKENRELKYLSQADLIEAFAQSRADLEKTSLSMAVCELVDKLEAGQEPNPLLFRLVLSTLKHIDATTKNPANIFRAFEIHISDIMGFRPHFENCISCQCEVAGELIFNLAGGGLVCEKCHEPGGHSFVLSTAALHALQTLQRVHISKLAEFLPQKRLQRQVDDFLSAFLRYHVEGLSALKSLQFLAKL